MTKVEQIIIKNNIEEQVKGAYVAPVVILGKPGIGKSTAVKEICTDMNLGLVNVSAATLTLAALSGIPSFIDAPDMDKYYVNSLSQTSAATQWSVPEMVQVANTEAEVRGGCVILLDDLHEMPRATQSALYELLLERKLGQYKLAQGVAIIATANNSEEANYNGFPSPVVNRLAFLDVDFNFDTWYGEVGINYNTYVSSFLKAYPERVQEEENTEGPYGTPRSYEFLSNTFNSMGNSFIAENCKKLAKQYISDGAAVDLTKHVEYVNKINFSNVVAKREMHNMDSKSPLDVILFSYITHYIESVEDGMYFIRLLDANSTSSMFIGFAANGLSATHRKKVKGEVISDGLRYVLDVIMEEPIIASDYTSTVPKNARTLEFKSRDKILATLSDYLL